MTRKTRTKKGSQAWHDMKRGQTLFAVEAKTARGRDVVWSQLRDRIVSALEAYPEAREALVRKLVEDLGLNEETRIQP